MPPWTLDIHTLDVLQGDCSVIVATDTAAGGHTHALLVDGGHTTYGSEIDDYIAQRQLSVQAIVSTNYDADHSGGLRSLLAADNLSAACDVVATLVTAEVQPNLSRAQLIAGCTAAALAAILGAYGAAAGTAQAAAVAARTAAAGNLSDAAAGDQGIQAATVRCTAAGAALRKALVRAKPTTRREAAARAIGIAAAATAIAGGNVALDTRNATFTELARGVDSNARLDTEGRYAGATVYDAGNVKPFIPGDWESLVAGKFMAGDIWITAPVTHQGAGGAAIQGRRRVETPVLLTEILGAGGPPAPQVFVVVGGGTTWPPVAGSAFPPSGQKSNDLSIGLIVRFNNFYFWTAGDLPSQGEDVAGANLMRTPLFTGAAVPNPGIASIKCGHHGSRGSTSRSFLATTHPTSAMISSGINKYGHPDEDVIVRLHQSPDIQFFYLTNCEYHRDDVPASQDPPLPQVVAGNKSRVAGGKTAAGEQKPGDIQLTVTEAASTAAPNSGRRYTVRYWERGAQQPVTDTPVF